ncbi:outer membrane protein TolC [Nonlabens dokdonensis]|uniref:Outer membrane efflux protein n=2 Tax=Nonlabens dokdonensis TaxID=328515 RepID=L7W8G6_NONDD|nr:TolC family protein [Nonlabens dokdonensis]AGC75168.1 outer membrane efflux protein [Nonlabens dokdonensis DSW-6]PZX39088.1 outer membrane protein TolC [Nonlabens dokdonensis]
MIRNSKVSYLVVILMLMVGMKLVAVPLSRKQTPQQTPQNVLQDTTIVMSLKEYLGYVKKHHPVVKQAGLIIDQGQAQLLKARGGFDPKIEVDYDRKDFKGTEYYDELRGAFKIPTWYGVEFKAGAERNEGSFLDPSLTVPEDGLYSAGVTVQLGQGLWINDRMATLRKAKLFRQQTQSERDLLVNAVLFDATQVYFEWWQAAQERELFSEILENSQIRLNAIKRSVEVGDKAVIDSVEARIAVKKRLLGFEQAKIDFIKKRLELSNYLWIDGVPVELQDNVVPEEDLISQIDAALEIMGQSLDLFTVENHPKILALRLKMDQLEVERQLKANKLLPKLEANYNFISPDWNDASAYNSNDYKAGIKFSTPLFLRKERGDVKLAEIKLQDAEYDVLATSLAIENKVKAIFNEIDSYTLQNEITQEIVEDSQQMLNAEIRKFDLGDSSLFLINSRENKLIESSLKRLEVGVKLLSSKARLFNSLALVPENL